MARSPQYWYDYMIAEKQTNSNLNNLVPNPDTNQTLLNDLTTPSKVADWRLWIWVVANSSQIRQDITFSIYDSVTNLSHIEQSSGAYGIFDFTTDEVIEILGQSVGGGSADGDIISRAGYIEYTPSK